MHKELAEAMPGVVFSGEHLHEVTFFRESFAQRWKLPPDWDLTRRSTPHPISAFLFSPYTLPYGYLGMPNPDRGPQLYQEYLDAYEIWGVLPTLRLSSVADLGPERMRTQELLSIARTWQEFGLKPDFESDWTTNTLFQYVGEDGEIAALKKTETGATFVLPEESLGYERVLGVTQVKTHRNLPHWRTYVVMVVQAHKRPLPTWRQAGAAAGLSVLGFSGYYLLLVLAIRDAGPALPTLMVGTIPLWVMLLGKPEHLEWKQLLPGLLLTAVGLVLMVDAPDSTSGQAWTYWRGVGYAVAAMLSWTAFAVLNSAWLKTHRDISTTDWANWMGVAAGCCWAGSVGGRRFRDKSAAGARRTGASSYRLYSNRRGLGMVGHCLVEPRQPGFERQPVRSVDRQRDTVWPGVCVRRFRPGACGEPDGGQCTVCAWHPGVHPRASLIIARIRAWQFRAGPPQATLAPSGGSDPRSGGAWGPISCLSRPP